MATAISPDSPVVDTPDASGPRRKTAADAQGAPIRPLASLDEKWSAASELLGARIDEVRGLLTDARRFGASVQIDWWVEDLEGVRVALDDLRATFHRAPPHLFEDVGGPIATYLTAAFVWCGDIASDVKSAIRVRQLGTERRSAERTSFIADSEAYIACFLDPFFRDLNVACADDSLAGNPIRTSAERLQACIASLHWALCGAFPQESR